MGGPATETSCSEKTWGERRASQFADPTPTSDLVGRCWAGGKSTKKTEPHEDGSLQTCLGAPQKTVSKGGKRVSKPRMTPSTSKRHNAMVLPDQHRQKRPPAREKKHHRTPIARFETRPEKAMNMTNKAKSFQFHSSEELILRKG